MSDKIRNFFIEERDNDDLTKHKLGQTNDIRPNETPTQWANRISNERNNK